MSLSMNPGIPVCRLTHIHRAWRLLNKLLGMNPRYLQTCIFTDPCDMLQVQAVHPLTRYRLQRLIGTREEDLVGMHRMGSIAALEKYAEGTASQLLYLQVCTASLPISSLECGSIDMQCIQGKAQ